MGDETVTSGFGNVPSLIAFLLHEGWTTVWDEEEECNEDLATMKFAKISYFVRGDEVYRKYGSADPELIWRKTS